jgi:hypothetical protein
MIHANGQESLTGVPWRDDGKKETTLAPARALMRAGDVVACSILNEAWSATPLEGWKPLSPSHGAKRSEVVIAAAYSRRRRNAAMWRIERNADGRCTDLVPMAGVDGMAARMLRYRLRPWEGRWRPLRWWTAGSVPRQGSSPMASRGARARIVGAHLDASRNRGSAKRAHSRAYRQSRPDRGHCRRVGRSRRSRRRPDDGGPH